MTRFVGYGGYPPRGPAPGTPSSTHATTPMSVDSGSAMTPKRKSLPSGPPPPPSGTAPPPAPPPSQAPPPSGAMVPPPRPKSQMGMSGSGTLADVDPETVPANMKVEGRDWFAL